MEKLTRESSCDENKRKDFPRWKIYLPNGRPQEGKWRKSYYPQLWNPGIYSMKNGTFSVLCFKQEYLGFSLCIRSRSDHFLALSKPYGLCWDLKDLTLGFRYTCSILEEPHVLDVLMMILMLLLLLRYEISTFILYKGTRQKRFSGFCPLRGYPRPPTLGQHWLLKQFCLNHPVEHIQKPKLPKLHVRVETSTTYFIIHNQFVKNFSLLDQLFCSIFLKSPSRQQSYQIMDCKW